MEGYRYTAIDPGEVAESEIDKARPLAWLSYISLLFIIPLFAMRGNRFALFHARQGLILFAYKVGLLLVSLILSIVAIGLLVFVVGEIILLVISLIGVVRSALGEFWECPLWVHRLAQRLPLA